MIALLTDFNGSDGLGVVKGVMKSVAPNADIVDFCNSISPFQVKSAAWVLLNGYRYFPKGSIFYCVVDPGVGGKRRAIAIKTTNYYFVGPDNGLMYSAASEDGVERVVELSTEGAAGTFHGRDVFAPAAAMLEKGEPITSLGREAENLQRLMVTSNSREGEVVLIEHYGNVITNIKPLKSKGSYEVACGKFRKDLSCHEIYGSAEKGELFAVRGSRDTLELAVREGSAAKLLNCRVGDKIVMK